MFKLMHKKLNKKGFTLAELLVVVAIVAILVAIAIPIFTNSMARAQIATNQANIRSTKAAAVSLILEHWDDSNYYNDSGAKGLKLGYIKPDGTESKRGWIASGAVDAEGNLTQVVVTVAPDSNTYTADGEEAQGYIIDANGGTPDLVKEFKKSGVTYTAVGKSGKISPAYTTVVYIPATTVAGKV